MSGFTPWRRGVVPFPPAPVDELAQQLRDMARRIREQDGQIEAAAKMVAGAKRECAERCGHAIDAAELRVTLHRMQQAADESMAADVARHRAALRAASPAVWTPRRPSGERA